jgi:primase-polymerase (primpol)-like protein
MKRLDCCIECGIVLSALARADAVFCSSRCRVRGHRRPFPRELTERSRWVRYSRSKIPLTIWDECAKVNDPKTWSDYKSASASTAGVGLGFVFNGDGFIGIDLDNAFNDGQLKPWAKAIVDKFAGTYIEVSPSGNGIHIITQSDVFTGRRFALADGGIEIYAVGRYFTMTGKRLGYAPKKIKKFKDALTSVLEIVEVFK